MEPLHEHMAHNISMVTNYVYVSMVTFPWSPSKVEVGTFYLFTFKVGSKYTYIILEALV